MKTEKEVSLNFLFERLKNSYKLICLSIILAFFLTFSLDFYFRTNQYTVEAIIDLGSIDPKINTSNYRFYYYNTIESKLLFNNIKYEKTIRDSSVISGVNLISLRLTSNSIENASNELTELCNLWILDLQKKKLANEFINNDLLVEKDKLYKFMKRGLESDFLLKINNDSHYLGSLIQIQNELFELRNLNKNAKLNIPALIQHPMPINNGKKILQSISSGLKGGLVGLLIAILILLVKAKRRNFKHE